MEAERKYVWVFNGGGAFPSGVFSSRERAETWIAMHRLSGCLTKYPLDQGAYEWAIETGHFKVRQEDQTTPKFIGKFACGAVHFHYADGHPDRTQQTAPTDSSESPERAKAS